MDAIVLRIGEVVVLWELRSLLLAPQPPGNDGQTADQDCTTHTANDTSNDLLTAIGKRGAAATAVLQGWGDGGCCKAGRTSYHTVGRNDGAVDGAIAGPEGCRCGWDGFRGDEGRRDDSGRGESRAVDGGGPYDDLIAGGPSPRADNVGGCANDCG